MAYDIKNKFKDSHYLVGKDIVEYQALLKAAKGVVKSSPTRQVCAEKSCSKADNPNKMLFKAKQTGGGTKKVCLPKAKIASMSSSEKAKVVNAKRAAGAKGKYKRSSSSNVTGTASRNLKHWVQQDWRQVGNPSKKCGEA